LKPAKQQRIPTNRLRRWAHWLCINERFEGIMVAVVAANAVCLALAHYGMTPQFASSLTLVRQWSSITMMLEPACMEAIPVALTLCTIGNRVH
jgi:hypothetical protein